MTSLTELAHMLIAVEQDGRELQVDTSPNRLGWALADMQSLDVTREYRLKPRTVYYRLLKAIPGQTDRLWFPEDTKPPDWQQRDDCIDIEREEA